MPKCKNCLSYMHKGYLRLDKETTAKISVCPKSNDLHLELKGSDLFFYCVKKKSKTPKKGEVEKRQKESLKK